MLKQFLKKAQKEKWAIGQFNFSTLEQLKGIALAAQELSAPVIVGTSEGEVKFLGLEETIALVRILENKLGIRLFLHLDHGRDPALIKQAIDFGYDSVHFDGSCFSFKKNVELTRKIVKMAQAENVLVEGEVGCLRGESGSSGNRVIISQKDLTKPEKAGEFVKKTGVDSLAISIGNVHGVYNRQPKLDFKRLTAIKQETDAFLVLHGGSGLAVRSLKKAIESGIQKVNISTDLRIIWADSLGQSLKQAKEIKPYRIISPTIQEINKKVKKYIKLFGSANKL